MGHLCTFAGLAWLLQQAGSGTPAPAQIHSWTLSDEIALTAIIIGFLQFVALIWTVVVMIRNGRRQLRAYVMPDQAGILEGNMLVPPQPAKANIPGSGMLIKNYGQTPAYNVVSWMQVAVIPVVQENIALTLPNVLEKRFPWTLGSGSSFSKALWFSRTLTANEITDIANGTQAIYVYGRIEYTDAFRKKRFTNFRLHYTGVFPPIPNAILLFSEQGNDAD